jgi:hypothetical protein
MSRCKTTTQCDRQHDRYRQRIAELEAENARLRKDKERLEHLVKKEYLVMSSHNDKYYIAEWVHDAYPVSSKHKSWREAVDETMQENSDE